MAHTILRDTVSSGRRSAWDLALSRSLRFALEALLMIRPGSGTLTLE